MLRRSITSLAAISLAAASTLALGTTSTASAAQAGEKTSPTTYALSASAYSTRVRGGALPAGSDKTAFQVIGCTNKAGLSKSNAEARLNVAPALVVQAAKTNVWTTKKNGVVSSWARNKIASITFGDPAVPTSPRLNAITSTSRAFHNATGFHARTTTAVGSFDPDGVGPMPAQSGPTPGNPILVPGLVKISVGSSKRTSNANGATALAEALRIKILPTSTVAFFAHSHATINGGVVSGLFKGSAYASQATALGGTVTSGKTPLVVMPCQGTDGKVIRRDVARVNPSGLVVKGLHADQSADQTRMKASGYERGRVARVRLGNATTGLVVRGIVGRANVKFVRGSGITRSAKSTILGVTFNGDPRTFGPDDVIEIPGVVRLQQHIVKRTKSTIQIIALRITLLGGPQQGAKIDLGVAMIGFNRAGL